jgi:hypothetical protein
MLAYLITIAKEIEAKGTDIAHAGEILMLLRTLDQELEHLDPKDFLPVAQSDFAKFRYRLHNYLAIQHSPQWQLAAALAGPLAKVLEQYNGEGSGARLRSFSFVKDVDLRNIIERDYRELKLRVFPQQAWKSTVILAGSILEAILYDRLSVDPAIKTRAMSSTKAPHGKDISAGDWKLFNLIEVATDIGVLPADRADTIDQVLRDYRNFVHPKKELRSKHSCGEAEATMAVGALEGVCNHLEKL